MSTAERSAGRGRRPGSPDTRAEVLAAAQEAFAQRGFAGTTIRAVAAEAGVDPALVHHYFGTKDQLFLAALQVPVDPRQLVAPVVAAGPEGAAARLLPILLSVWDDPELQVPLLALARRALEPGGERLLRDGFLPVVLTPVGRGLGLQDPERRMAMLASQVVGLIVARYLLRFEPIASMSRDEVVTAYAPALQHILTGDLDGPSGA